MRTWTASVAVVVCAALLGCVPRLPLLTPGAPLPASGEGADAPVADPTLRGTVDLASLGRHAQASLTDAGNGATVSLIDTSTNLTVSTSLSSATGQFSLQFTGQFKPVVGRTYFLEAVKGLSNNMPASNAARIRTLLQWQAGGWTSLTSALAESPVTLNVATSALAAIQALRSAAGTPVAAAALIGSLQLGVSDSSLAPTTPDTFVPVTNCTNQDFHAAWDIVSRALSADRDPMQAIGLNTGSNTFFLSASGVHVVTSLSPSTGSVATAVAVNGAHFDPVPANNVVQFGNQATASVAGTSTVSRLDVTVPIGALTGQLAVRIGSTISLGPNFVVVPTLTSFSPTNATTSTSVVITGTGFDPTAANDTVQFNGVPASVTAASDTSLTVAVPAAATTGRLTVATSGGTATSATNFTVKPWIAALSTSQAATGSTLILTGTGFTATGSVSFNGANAGVSAWSNTGITVTVPANATNGPVTVTTTAGTSNGRTFTVAWQWCDGGKSCWDPAGNFYFVVNTDKLYKVPAGTTTPQIIGTVAANPNPPALDQVVYGPDGNLWLSNYSCNDLVKFNLTTNAFTVVRSASGALLGMAWNPDQRTLYLAGSGGIYKYDLVNNTMSAALAGSPPTCRSIVCDAQGNTYFTSGNTWKVHKIASGSVAITDLVAMGTSPAGLAIDPANNLYYQSAGTVTKFNVATPTTQTTVATGLDTNSYHNLLYRDSEGLLYSLLATLQIAQVAPTTGVKTPWVTTPAKAWF